jgi:AcrR family transcriptional regulator
MSSQDRRDRERLQTRARILDAARELFARDGYEAVSLRQVAETIEYSPAAIYVHFADKEALFRELASADFRALARAFGEIGQIADPLTRLVEVGRAYIEFGLSYPNHYRLMFMTPQSAGCSKALAPDAPARKGNPAEDGYAFLRQCVGDAVGQKLIRPDLTDVDLVAQTMWAGVHGVASLEITMGKDAWIQWAGVADRIGTMALTLVRGIARDPAQVADRATPRPPAGARKRAMHAEIESEVRG